MWIRPASKLQVEEQLFYFLRSLCAGRLPADQPLLVEQATLQALYADPHHELVEALRYCLDSFLVELGPDAAQWGEFSLSPAVLGMALATYNCLIPPVAQTDEAAKRLTQFGAALVQTLPPARELPQILTYHALLHRCTEALPNLTNSQAALMHALLNLSPLSAIYHLHLHTPPPLTPLAAELLPGWKNRVADPTPWSGLADWLNALTPALKRPAIATYLRRRWLTLPETRPVCRNLGLFLEALRRHGGHRAFILDFYEAYEYFCGQIIQDPWCGPIRHWSALDQAERLLRTGGDNEVAIHLNRWGNEYFLKFRPLIQTVIDDGHQPTDYNLLTDNLILAAGSLLDLVTEDAGQRLNLGKIAFAGEEGP